jgi:hypothetical protein
MNAVTGDRKGRRDWGLETTEKREETSARRQKSGGSGSTSSPTRLQGKKVGTVSFLTFFNWIVISAMLHWPCKSLQTRFFRYGNSMGCRGQQWEKKIFYSYREH